MPEGLPLSQFLRTRSQAMRHPSKVLFFFEVHTPDLVAPILRYVDFADPDARGSLPKKVPFNAFEWDSIPIQMGEVESSQEGSTVEIPVTILDPLHQAAFFIRKYTFLIGQLVRWYLTTYDNLANPADAFSETLTITNSRISQGPDAVTLYLGQWNVHDSQMPWLFYSRTICQNSYPLRFDPDSNCTYPSNEFSAQTQQDYLAGGVYAEKKRKFGWSTQMALKATKFDAHFTSPGRLTMESVDSSLSWSNERRFGPYFYRALAGDFDVYTSIAIPATSRGQYFAGLVVQDEIQASPIVEPGGIPPPVPVSSWLLWATQGSQLLLRSTAADVSSDFSVSTSDKHLRLVRSGNDFTLYSRASEAAAWTERSNTTLALPTRARIGLVAGSDEVSTLSFRAEFDYLRFLSGGLPLCGRTGLECALHENLHQNNAFEEIPNDRVRN